MIDIRGIRQIFDKCTQCNKKMPEILIPISDREAIKKQEAKERLCNKCKKDNKFADDVLTYELRKAGLIK